MLSQRRVSDYWPEQPADDGRLRIFVKLPAITGEQCLSFLRVMIPRKLSLLSSPCFFFISSSCTTHKHYVAHWPSIIHSPRCTTPIPTSAISSGTQVQTPYISSEQITLDSMSTMQQLMTFRPLEPTTHHSMSLV